jgi:5-methylcytosine-specific restriction endonuclease McrA
MTREQYTAYLASPEWWAIREAVMRRAKGKCEDCRLAVKLGRSFQIADATEVHHLTYCRLGRELPEDLIAVCEDHHKLRHGRPTKADVERKTGRKLDAALRNGAAA